MDDNFNIKLHRFVIPIIISTVSLVILLYASFTTGYDNFYFLASVIYAQTDSQNTTALPPVQMEPVNPQENDELNSTSFIKSSINTSYDRYDDSDFGFVVDYPSDWEVTDKDLKNNAVVVWNPPDGSVQVNVKSFPRTNSESLKSFGDKFFKKSDSFRISAYYRNSTTLLGGHPAIRSVATLFHSPNFFESLRGEQATTKKTLSMTTLSSDRKSFLQLIYYADKSNFMDYLPQVEHMLKSFQFKNAKPVIQEEN